MSRVGLLLAQMDEVYGRLRGRLEGLSDEEYLWEPVPGCWTVHRDPSGAWVADYVEPDPDPPPFTTIGWRLVHLADCKVMYHEWALASAASPSPTWPPRPRRPPPWPGWRRAMGGCGQPWRALATSTTGRAGPTGASLGVGSSLDEGADRTVTSR
jgi:DinB superfamily